VLEVERGTERVKGELASIPLLAGDKLFVAGSPSALQAAQHSEEFIATPLAGMSAWNLDSQLFSLQVTKDSVLDGSSIRSSRLGEMLGLLTLGIIRENQLLLACSPDEVIKAHDKLLIFGDLDRLKRLKLLSQVELEHTVPATTLESDSVRLFEVSLTPRSSVVGKTVHELHFRELYGMQVLAIWRAGDSIRTGLRYVPLRFGDALLLLGPPSKIQLLSADPDFVVLSDLANSGKRSAKAPLAAACFMLFVLLVTLIDFPVQIAAAISAILLVLFGAITMEDVYRSVEWRILLFVGALIPLGEVLMNSGAAADLASTIQLLSSPLGAYGALLVIILISSLVSQLLDSTLSVILLAPVAVATATALSVKPYPFLMGTAFAASIAFLFPFSHRSHLLVMGAGGYTKRHYLQVGFPLTVILITMLTILVPLCFPF